jgi:hypothetical protein
MKAIDIITLAETLLENQIQINKLQKENSHIKSIIVEHIEVDQVIESGDGIIECRHHEDSKALIPRNEVLNYIFEKYGKTIAQDVDKNCTITRTSKKTIYIKPDKRRKLSLKPSIHY